MLRDYEVHIFNLSKKKHTFDFQIADDFFTHFENSPIDKAQLTVALILDKRENLIEAQLTITGHLGLVCDVSLEEFDYPVKIKQTIIYKFGETEEELDDDLYTITKNTQKLDFAQILFEVICIAVPMKKLHPELEVSDEPLVYRVGDEPESAESEQEEIDPRWQALKGLKNKEE
jgi:uncharacterized protein